MGGRLKGKKALITGASSGIGAGVALAFAREGADVAINYPTKKQKTEARQVAGAIRDAGRLAYLIEADVSKEAPVRRLVSETLRMLGRIDILVNNAGIVTGAPVDKMSVATWDEMIGTNLRSVFLVTRFVLPHMYRQGSGKIVNNASQKAYVGSAGHAHYCAAKAGIIAFTRSLSREIGARNINANCVAPGATYTRLLDGVDAKRLKAIRAAIPRGDLARVDQIVPAFVYLASDEASHMVGQTISPNGGEVML